MIPAEGSQRAAKRGADRRFYRHNQARTRGQVPAPPVRPVRPVKLQFSRDQLPHIPGAPCASHDPELWFSDSQQDIAQAKAICRGCADRLPCLASAIQRRETYGIWGGTDLNPDRRQEDVA